MLRVQKRQRVKERCAKSLKEERSKDAKSSEGREEGGKRGFPTLVHPPLLSLTSFELLAFFLSFSLFNLL